MGIDAGVMLQTPTAVAGERVAERRTMASLETPVFFFQAEDGIRARFT